MKKEELEAIGLTKEQIRAVQRLHGLSMAKARKHAVDKTEAKQQAITAIIKVLKEPDSLDKVLHSASTAYHYEIIKFERGGQK